MSNSDVCDDDNDCRPNFYCYKISKRCVNFIVCSRYNRAEGMIPARNPSQCGPCMAGYTTEILANDRENSLCQRNVTNENHEGLTMNTMIWIIVVILTSICTTMLLYSIRKYRFFKKWCKINCKINCFEQNSAASTANVAITNGINNNNNIYIDNCSVKEEQTPFIDLVGDKYLYDKNRLTTNEYQTARPFVSPVWTENQFYHSNNNYGHVSNEENVVTRLQSNIPGNIQSIMESAVELLEINIEQQDNARNTTLLQTYPSDDDTNPSSEPNESSTDKEKTTINITQALNQNIKMNVNILKT